jgi:signal transduction histidine kinase
VATQDPSIPLLVALSRPEARELAVANLAQHVGAETLFLLVPDVELGTLLPAPGMPQTLPGGPSWRALLGERLAPGSYPREVAWPDRATLRPATLLVMEDGTTFVFVGEGFDPDRLDTRLLPLVGALVKAEQAAAAAAGTAAAAREAARHATSLNAALDSTRAELEHALEEEARLNRELAKAIAGEREARQEAEATNRAKDEFLATLGHELRNPLAPIVTALHLLKLRHKRDAPQEVQVIERQITNVIRLVDDLLDISRIARGKAELDRVPIEISVVAARAVEMITPQLQQRQHQFRMEVPSQGLMVEGDEGRLAQVLTNLLTNAARYTPPGGHIRLAARRLGEEVEITVTDSGIGIEPEMLPRIFDLFVQGGRARERGEQVGGGGLGIGLALVRNLVHMHGGTVSAHNNGPDERGCTFTIRLPRLPERSLRPLLPEDDGSLDAMSLPSQRVLVVDDNADTALLLAELLRGYGHVVETATDGPSALREAERFQPDTAILDIGLPMMDGYELARQLSARPQLKGVRLIALSGYGLAQDRARAEAAGFHGHLTKPVRAAELLEALTPPA